MEERGKEGHPGTLFTTPFITCRPGSSRGQVVASRFTISDISYISAAVSSPPSPYTTDNNKTNTAVITAAAAAATAALTTTIAVAAASAITVAG